MKFLLRATMIGVVLINLGFVSITDSTRLNWLLPLYLLTVASPFLLPMTRWRAYGWLWNSAILITFALLVNHVSRHGAQYLLEDGLQLAGLCQVHLVNNLTDRQRPDILYFNSFLIAVVTSFLSFDLAYFALFVGYAPLLIVSMHLLTLSRRLTTVDRLLLRGVVAQGCVRSLGVLLVTALAFLFLPRDFERRGPLGELNFSAGSNFIRVDFNKDIDLSQSGMVGTFDRVVLKVRRVSGALSRVPCYWRGATLDLFDGAQWRAAGDPAVSCAWSEVGHAVWRRGVASHLTEVEVDLLPPLPARLFVPLAARRVELLSPDQWRAVEPCADLTFRHDRSLRERQPRSFRVGLAEEDDVPPTKEVEAPQHLHLALSSVPEALRALHQRLQLRSDPKLDAARRVERVRRYLAERLVYLAPGEPGAAQSLEDFAAGSGGGHCEYFATVLALLLRMDGIACRVVTGFCSQEWDAAFRTLTIRSNHAHAWVEVFDPLRGWYTVDATPAGIPRGVSVGSWLSQWRARLQDFWEAITSFDAQARARVFGGIGESMHRTWNFVRSTPWFSLGSALVIGALLWFARWRKLRRIPVATRAYLTALKKGGATRRETETPRELIGRLRGGAHPAALLRALEAATEQHEAKRYSSSATRTGLVHTGSREAT